MFRARKSQSILVFTLWLALAVGLCPFAAHAQTDDAPSVESDETSDDNEDSSELEDEPAAEGEDESESEDDAENSESAEDPREDDVINEGGELTEEDPFRDLRGPAQRRGTDEKPIDSMNESELKDAGFVFSDRDRSDLSSTGTILSLTVGSLVHGVGHFYIGDSATGLFLFGMEMASIVAMLGAGVYAFSTGNADGGVAFSSGLFKLGVSGFFASWVLDILGTLQGDQIVFPVNEGPERGMYATIGYRLVEANGTPMRHGFDAGLAFDNDFFRLSAGTTQDVLLDLQQYRARIGTRPLIAAPRLTWLGASGGAEYTRFTGFGEFGHLDVDAQLEFSMALAAISSSFDQLSAGGSIGWGQRATLLPDETDTLEWGERRDRFLFDLHGELGVTERLSARVGYRNSDGILFPAQSPFVGITYLDLLYRSAGFGDLILGAAFGDGVMLTAGGRLWLWRP